MSRGPWIQTYTGRKFHPLDPRPDDIDIVDIAHSLSMICRFNGHCRSFYSVAQHSVLVAQVSAEQAPEAALWGLLHDASEAYIGDVTRPVKTLLADFRDIEARIADAIVAHYQVPRSESILHTVHTADDVLLATEARDLMAEPPDDWVLQRAPMAAAIEPWDSATARERFLETFSGLARSVA